MTGGRQRAMHNTEENGRRRQCHLGFSCHRIALPYISVMSLAPPIHVLILSFALVCAGPANLPGDTADDGENGRSRRHARREFCCTLPWNEEMNDVYMQCGVFNETKEGSYGFPLRNEDPLPDFRYALLCREKTEDEHFKSNCDSNEEMDIEHGCGDTSIEDDMLHCLEKPRTHCEARCVFQTFGAVDSNGKLQPKKLYDLAFQTLSRNPSFKHAAHHGVKSCLCKHKKMEKIYGENSMDTCALIEIMAYCIDYETSKHCPDSSKSELNEEGECPTIN